MKNECSITKDLLPLYAENMLSPESAAFVEEHLQNCDGCRMEYAECYKDGCAGTQSDCCNGSTGSGSIVSGGSGTADVETDITPLLRLREKMAAKKIKTVVLTALFVLAFILSAVFTLTEPLYLSYSKGLVHVEETDEGLRITFDKSVRAFEYERYPSEDGRGMCICDIRAWTTLWDKWFTKPNGMLSDVIIPEEDGPVAAIYVTDDSGESICIYGDAGAASHISLPRLTPGYYFILALFVFAVVFTLRMIIKRRNGVHTWLDCVMLYPLSYVISHVIIMGFRFTSYTMPRDFMFTFFVSVLIYCALLLVHGVFRLRREIREIKGL